MTIHETAIFGVQLCLYPSNRPLLESVSLTLACQRRRGERGEVERRGGVGEGEENFVAIYSVNTCTVYVYLRSHPPMYVGGQSMAV